MEDDYVYESKRNIRVYYKITKKNDPSQSYIGEIDVLSMLFDHTFRCDKLYTRNKKQYNSRIIKIMREVGFDKWDINVIDCIKLKTFKEQQSRLDFLRYIHNTTLPTQAKKITYEIMEYHNNNNDKLEHYDLGEGVLNVLKTWIGYFENAEIDMGDYCNLPTCEDCNDIE